MTAQFHSFVRRLLIPAVLGFAASGTANAATIQLRASLNGAQEVSPVATSATGMATVTYDTVTGQLSWNVTYSGLSSNINGAHFHGPTPAGFDASITVPMSHGPSPIVGSATINSTQAAELLSGQWYINLHSDNFAGGEIRGQVAVVRGDLDGDGQSDVVWRNVSTGDNYLYPMNGTAILAGEGYLRQVADQNWQIAGIGDFDGDGKADILWRNSVTGENYIYLMNGKDIAGEGYIRTVADQNWKMAGVGDLDGDGKSDIVWRNSSTGENYLYPMDGLAIKPTEGYLRTVANLGWAIAGIGDFDGDGMSDILWRNSSTGENYIYLMNGTAIQGEGYVRTVADANWRIVAGASRQLASSSGLEFPSNGEIPNGETVRFKFTRPDTRGLPIYGPGGNGVTYIFKVLPKQQTGFYTTFFWANDDGKLDPLDIFFWKNGVSDTYYGAHPYPDWDASPDGTTHKWEISVNQGDVVNGAVDYGRWHTQALQVWRDASGNKHHEFYWDLPFTDGAHSVTYVAPPTYGEENPPEPTLTFGDAPWNPSRELCSCVLRGIQIYSSLLSLTEIQQEIAAPLSTTTGSAWIWYLNVNPTPTDISDKSGRGHHPVWVGPRRPSLWSQ
jgi:hypothetical protein